MYVDTYDQNLGGLGKKLKKLGRRVGKVLKKVAKPIAHIGAAALTGGASLALSANIIRSSQARKAAQKQANLQAQIAREQIASQERIATGMVSTPASTMTMTRSIAPPANLVRAAMPTPTYTLAPQSFAPGGEYAPSPAYEPAGGGDKPAWLMPAAIGGVGLLAVMMLGRRQQ